MAKPHLTAPVLTAKQVAYFHSKVAVGAPDECWPWMGGTSGNGYGKLKLGKRTFGPHVLARWLATDEWPGGRFTCHRCDNKPCCNPDHLFLGTALDNMRDMIAKGRDRKAHNKGEASGRAKLTEAQVLEIRRLHATGLFTYVELGHRFGVHPVSIRLIVLRINWPHLL